MAFGTKFANAGDRDLHDALIRTEKPTGAHQAPAPVEEVPSHQAPPHAPAAPVRTRFGLSLGPVAPPSPPSVDGGLANRLASRFGLKLDAREPAAAPVSRPSAPITEPRPSAPLPARPTSGSVRLDFLIERAIAGRRLDRQGEARLRQEAAAHPAEMALRLEKDLKDGELLAEKRVHSLKDGMAKKPNSVVALFIKGPIQDLKDWPRATAGPLVLLHGATVESVEARQTPFPPPIQLRPAAPVEVAVVPDEGAFEAASRPRP